MMRKKEKTAAKKPNKPLYIVLSVLIACGLWLYVNGTDDSDRTNTIYNIPVTFVGEDVLNAKGLMLAPDTRETVSLTVQGRQSVVAQLRRDNIVVQVDLSGIAGEGKQERAYDIIWPSNVSTKNFDLKEYPTYVPLTVMKRSTRRVEIQLITNGKVADGFQSGEVSFQPAYIELSGPEADTAQAAYARVTLNVDGVRETIREDMPYELIGQDGEPLENDNIMALPETVNVTLPVVMTKSVPIKVSFISGGGVAGGDDPHVEYTITPKSIVLSGGESDLAAYSAIDLGSIDLAKVIRSESVTFPILIGPEVENVSGVTEATVNVSVKDLEIRDFTVDRIELNNPHDVRVNMITQQLTVKVRGSKSALDQVATQNIQAVVDLSDLSAIPDGQSQIPVKVSLRGVSEAGVVGEYKISAVVNSR